jgi:L-ascorbate metabolism protein UlaG (beta-lactamase superfamily)
MTLTYLYHSGFAIENDNIVVIIDFFKDSLGRTKGVVHDSLLKKNKPMYVLASHAHPDHFNADILNWNNANSTIQYIFSQDIADSKKVSGKDIHFLNKSGIFKDNNLTMQAYGSTDIGISFLIKIDGKSIFHAGDLNNWHWKDESTEEEAANCERAYLQELEELTTDYPHINLALFPVDPHLGTDYMLGAKQFIDRIRVDYFAPMHFGEAYEKAAILKPYAESKSIHFIAWKHKGEKVEIY